MFVSESLSVDENGVLCIGGANALDIAKEFGTPVYVMDVHFIKLVAVFKKVIPNAFTHCTLTVCNTH